MNLFETKITASVAKGFSTQILCIEYLEILKWSGKPASPYSGSRSVYKRKGLIRWHCNDTNKDFSVLAGTIFEGSKYPLPQWFKLIQLLLESSQGISTMEIMRILNCSYKTAWFCSMKIRCAMIDESSIEYSGNQKMNYHNDSEVLNLFEINRVFEKNNKIFLDVNQPFNSKNLLEFFNKGNAKSIGNTTSQGLPVTISTINSKIENLVFEHCYDKNIYKNHIEVFWSILRNCINSQSLDQKGKYLVLYILQAQYVFNIRNSKEDIFNDFIRKLLISNH